MLSVLERQGITNQIKNWATKLKMRLELNNKVGIKVGKNFLSLVIQTREYENLMFGDKHYRNNLDRAQRLRLGLEDVKAIHKYFLRIQTKNLNVLYSMDLDDGGWLKNVFWTTGPPDYYLRLPYRSPAGTRYQSHCLKPRNWAGPHTMSRCLLCRNRLFVPIL